MLDNNFYSIEKYVSCTFN